MQFFGKMSRFTHFFLGSAQTIKIIPSSAFKFFHPWLYVNFSSNARIYTGDLGTLEMVKMPPVL